LHLPVGEKDGPVFYITDIWASDGIATEPVLPEQHPCQSRVLYDVRVYSLSRGFEYDEYVARQPECARKAHMCQGFMGLETTNGTVQE
jgi:hypothetical protein